LLGFLGDRAAGGSNTWQRETAIRILGSRSTDGLEDLLKKSATDDISLNPTPQRPFHFSDSLGALWIVYQRSMLDHRLQTYALAHPDPFVRLWTARLIGDETNLPPELGRTLAQLSSTEINAEVRAQLACTAKRLAARNALPIIHNLLHSSARSMRSETDHPKRTGDKIRLTPDAAIPQDHTRDPRLPLLCWWAIESKCESDPAAVLKLFEDSPFWTLPIVEQHLLERIMRRFAASSTRKDMLVCARLLELSPSREHSVKLMGGFEAAFKGRSLAGLPDELIRAMARHNVGSQAFHIRQGRPEAIEQALKVINNPKANKETRLQFIEILGEVRPPAALDALLSVADNERDPHVRKAALTSLLGFDDPRVAAIVVKDFNAYAPEVRATALTLVASRATWSLALVQAVEGGRIPAGSVPLDAVRGIKRHKGEDLARLITKHWPQTGSPTTEAMQQQMQRFGGILRNGKGDPYSGQKLFNAACASCHTLFARGGKVGPDLTSYQRGDLDAMLLHIVNPSAEIREGYENLLVETKDERSLSGFLVERDAKVVVLRGADGQNITLEQGEIAEMRAAQLSLMPEGLLDDLTEQQVRDLFAYLCSTQPLAN
jgi:putative heme-binding domain-containing protein